jgi:hypothetical protein
LVLIFTYNLSSRFRELKEEENRRKLNKALAAGDSNASASTYDSEDEESDDETTEEVLLTSFQMLIYLSMRGHCEASCTGKSSLPSHHLKIKFLLYYSCQPATGRPCGENFQYWE